MKKIKARSQFARRIDNARAPLDPAKRSNSAANPDCPAPNDDGENTARHWPAWLNKQPTPQQIHPKDPIINVGCQDGTTVSTVKPHEDRDSYPHADVEKDIIETGKEKIMHTAKQDNAPSKVDLRDIPTGNVNAFKETVKPVIDDDIGSLFGPAIKDDVKGVRNQIRELIQCEMQGELGQRFSRNLRIVIRREIAAAIDDQFDRV